MSCGKNFYNSCPPGRGPTGPTGPTGSSGVGFESTGRVLTVDQIYGDDVSGASAKYTYPFLTINGALSNVSAGDTIFLRPGTYNETVQMVSGTALRGQSVQTVTIQNIATVSTTLLTMSTNCRVEDVTLTLSSASNVQLTGILYPGGTPQTSKLRTAVVNVTNTNGGNASHYGVYANGSTSTVVSSANAIRACTVNVSGAGTGRFYSVYTDGSNRFSARDTNFYATGINSVGGGVSNPNGILELRTSTMKGDLYDIYRLSGTLLLVGTDLLNANANALGFSVNIEGATINCGVVGNQNAGTRYWLPGTVAHNALPTTPFGIPFSQKLIVFSAIATMETPIVDATTSTLKIFKNSILNPPLFTLSLDSNNQTVRVSNACATFDTTDRMLVQHTVSGSIGDNPTVIGITIY